MADYISTGQCPDEEQPADFWCRAMYERTGIRYEIFPDEDIPFVAHISLCRLDALSLGLCRGTPARVVRNTWPETRLVAFTFQLEGECLFVQDDNEVFLEPGNFCIYPYAGRAEFHHFSPYRQIYALLNTQLSARTIPQWALSGPRALSADTPSGKLLFDMLQSACSNAHGLSSAQAFDVCSVLVNLAGSVLINADASPQNSTAAHGQLKVYHLKSVKDFVLAHLCDPDLDITAIAHGVNLSARYIHHLFASEPLRLMEWVWDIRLIRAARELGRQEEQRRSIGEIAYACGFNDRSHFSHAFRRRFGISPREFRVCAAKRLTPKTNLLALSDS
jgi:AraC-like DNA-binding protein